ncbi:hypothetical protein ANN_03899 [Periplaneta americana]|uniref:Mariner Mos1 transposase n=1 Tax=Periplaneta americana TaxID=6978 RepID=A0ABQ8T7U1_PERAM|nr:hypothetical protein ANN_03899 [Periplaneta americana]
MAKYNARPHTANAIKALLQKFKWEVLCHPSYNPDFSPCDSPFWSPKKGPDEQTIHLGRRRQAIPAKQVYNASLGILRDSHSPPYVAGGQVPQQPGPILLTYRYLFLFLSLLLVSFRMPLIEHAGNSDVKKFANGTWCSQAVIHPKTDHA